MDRLRSLRILTRTFREVFGEGAAVVAAAPGRVNLIGEHTDYNEGFVFPVAIDRTLGMAVAPRPDRMVRLYSVNFEAEALFPVDVLQKDPGCPWADYPKGVVDELLKAGYSVGGFQAVLYGDIPLGAGLSSSAALEVVTAFALSELFGIELAPVEMALLCQRAENRFVGVNCGIMDPFISRLGKRNHALFIDCRDLQYRHVPLDGERVAVMVCNSGVQRGLVDSEYNLRRAQCAEGVRRLSKVSPDIRALRDVSVEALEAHADLLPDVVRRRCRHVVTENARVLQAMGRLEQGDLEEVGRLMGASHRSLQVDYEVSRYELDVLVELAQNMEGVLGARLTGAGFGGCTVNLVEWEGAGSFVEHMAEAYLERTGLRLETYVCGVEDGVQRIWV